MQVGMEEVEGQKERDMEREKRGRDRETGDQVEEVSDSN